MHTDTQIHTCTQTHKDSSWGAAVEHRELSSVICDDLQAWNGGGREAQERGNKCIFMTDSHFCMAETNTTL